MPQYYCHNCRASFDIDESAQIACTRCHGEFVEIVNRPASEDALCFVEQEKIIRKIKILPKKQKKSIFVKKKIENHFF